jgi:hypothetical protein
MNTSELEGQAIRLAQEQFFAINLNTGGSGVVAQPAPNPILSQQQTLNLSFAILGCAIAVGAIILVVRSRSV